MYYFYSVIRHPLVQILFSNRVIKYPRLPNDQGSDLFLRQEHWHPILYSLLESIIVGTALSAA
jgi:hypothetical protein